MRASLAIYLKRGRKMPPTVANQRPGNGEVRGALEAKSAELSRQLADAQARLRAVEQIQERLLPYAGVIAPVYLSRQLEPSAHPSLGASRHRIMVCSIPKAGTYLMGELLSRLGCQATSLHLWADGLSDYRLATLREARQEYHRFTVRLPLMHALGLILPGQYAVGHIECSEMTRRALAAFKKVFIYRDLRDAVVSHMRFIRDTGREGDMAMWRQLPDGPEQMHAYFDHFGPLFFRLARPMIEWQYEPDVLKVAFENLYGDSGAGVQRDAIRAVHQFLEVDRPLDDPDTVALAILGRSTLTWSGNRTDRERYWNGTIEDRFCSFGGPELNARLGYRS